ncbi:MAG: AbrB/MazE/SpoVT family DNA-binding domain-containing protein [Dethiobacter sp.]|jgi:AbrB family looped-hinge helix DNA binding protein|nr:MAG: AbrB/MazE/SpoVT family DNA-binding domain-containing protein [Dethiobacter sp.]
MKKVKVTSKGQITLPRSLREQLNIKEGDYLDASIHSSSLLLKPVPRQSDAEIIREHCKKYNSDKAALEETRRILKKVPFSLSERASKLREE